MHPELDGGTLDIVHSLTFLGLTNEWTERTESGISLSNSVKIIASKILKGLCGERPKGKVNTGRKMTTKTLFINSKEIRVTFGKQSQRTI